jgi:hypothetical protein
MSSAMTTFNPLIRLILLYGFGVGLVICALLTAQYVKTQSDLVLEGNNLYSSEAVSTADDFQSIAEPLKAAGVAFVAYREIDPSSPIRVMYISPGNTPSIPLHGRVDHFKIGKPQAWVGESVQTATASGRPIFQLGNRSFPVTARLGHNAKSLLSEDTVLVDNTLFTSLKGQTVFDGVNIRSKIATLTQASLTKVLPGTSHRTNVDLISPVIFNLNALVIGLGGTVYGLFAASSVTTRNKVMRTVGWSSKRTAAQSFAETMMPLAAFSVVAGFAVTYTTPNVNVSWLWILLGFMLSCSGGAFSFHYLAKTGARQ